MIYVIDKYGIEVSDKCFAAGKIGKVKQTDKKTNVTSEIECIQNPAYCTSVQSALKTIRKRMQMDGLKNFNGDLETAIVKIQDIDARFEEIVSKIKF